MDKKKKEIILVALLAPLLAFVVYTNLISPSEKKKKPPPKAPVKEAAPAAPVSAGKIKEERLPPLDKAAWQRQEEIARQDWGRDPFNPAPISPEEINRSSNWQAFHLSGVIPSPEGGVAILDGEVIGLGEEHRGYRLIKVKDRRITLEKNGEEVIIRMSEE